MRKMELVFRRLAGEPMIVKGNLVLVPQTRECEWCAARFLRDEVVYVMRAPPYKVPAETQEGTEQLRTLYSLCVDCSGKDLGDLT